MKELKRNRTCNLVEERRSLLSASAMLLEFAESGGMLDLILNVGIAPRMCFKFWKDYLKLGRQLVIVRRSVS